MLSTPPTPDPRYSFTSSQRYDVGMKTGGLGVSYYVNGQEILGHTAIGPELKAEGVTLGNIKKVSSEGLVADAEPEEQKTQRTQKKDKRFKHSTPALSRFEATVERVYTQELYTMCQRGMEQKERRKEQEVGVFGIGTDWNKVRRIEAEKVESCDKLRELGVIR